MLRIGPSTSPKNFPKFRYAKRSSFCDKNCINFPNSLWHGIFWVKTSFLDQTYMRLIPSPFLTSMLQLHAVLSLTLYLRYAWQLIFVSNRYLILEQPFRSNNKQSLLHLCLYCLNPQRWPQIHYYPLRNILLNRFDKKDSLQKEPDLSIGANSFICTWDEHILFFFKPLPLKHQRKKKKIFRSPSVHQQLLLKPFCLPDPWTRLERRFFGFFKGSPK